MFKKKWLFNLLVLIFSLGLWGGIFIRVQAASNLNGRILLQVQDRGQAWYVNPLDSKRYYLGRPEDAFIVMRSFALGVSNVDFEKISKQAPLGLAGRILLKVQDQGRAYYVEPRQLKLYYLGRPSDAFNIMRSLGLGITNSDLAKIPSGSLAGVAPAPAPLPVTDVKNIRLSFKYQGLNREIFLPLSGNLYNSYAQAPKVYTYSLTDEPADLREAFYGLFFQLKPGDTAVNELVTLARSLAQSNNWSPDQLAEFLLALVQYIPYDHDKLISGNNSNPYYPYETLYLDKGVCSDKTFLAVLILRKLGYGAAILDFPDINHTAAGIACPQEYSLAGSGYCYIETTNYFPFSVIPQNISGQATTSSEFSSLFDPAILGRIEIRQKTSGQIYQGAAQVRQLVEGLKAAQLDLEARQSGLDAAQAALTSEENDLAAWRAQLDAYYQNGQLSAYNNLVGTYNAAVVKYNTDLEAYRLQVSAYNEAVATFNQLKKDFYQQ